MLCLSVWLSSMTSWSPGRVRVAAGSGEAVVGREQLLDLAGHPHPRGDEHDEVVTDPLEVGDQMRGEHDADPVLGHDLHQALQELPPGQRVQARDRLVEQQQLGPLGDREGQGELGALAAGERAGPLPRVEAELPRSGARRARRPSPG